MPLKSNKVWSQERCRRKLDQTLGPYEEYVRRHFRRTARLGVAFVLNVGLITPFFAGMPWHRYQPRLGNLLLFLCAGIFLAFLFEAGVTFNYWRALRRLRQSEWSYLKATRKVGSQGH